MSKATERPQSVGEVNAWFRDEGISDVRLVGPETSAAEFVLLGVGGYLKRQVYDVAHVSERTFTEWTEEVRAAEVEASLDVRM